MNISRSVGSTGPLTPEAQPFKELLDLSNRFCGLIVAQKFEESYEVFTPRLRNTTSKEWYLQQMARLKALYGNPESFDENEWNFAFHSPRGVELVSSIKLLNYSRGTVKFVFTARKDKPLDLVYIQWSGMPTNPDHDTQVYHSGPPGDAHRPGPLSGETIQFRQLLMTGNQCLELLIENKVNRVYEDFFARELKDQITLAGLVRSYDQILKMMGPARTFEANQWTFVRANPRGRKLLVLQKLAHHEEGPVLYKFVALEEEQSRIIGFQFVPRLKRQPETSTRKEIREFATDQPAQRSLVYRALP